jgi:V/A-type H+-transporting ATPase subunit E
MSKGSNNTPHPIASGVEALIERLRNEGVDEGRSKAQRIISEAETRASWMVAQAREEAERITHRAREEARRSQKGAEEAMLIAARDALLSVKAELTQQFAGKVRRLVSETVSKEKILEQMVLELVGRTRDEVGDEGEVEVILPHDVIGVDELRRNINDLKEGPLSNFIRAQSTDMVREGVSFGVSEEGEGGLRLKLQGGEIELDMTDQALAALLLQHLQPRFRALLEGIIS